MVSGNEKQAKEDATALGIGHTIQAGKTKDGMSASANGIMASNASHKIHGLFEVVQSSISESAKVHEVAELVKSSTGGPSLERLLDDIGRGSLKQAAVTRDLLDRGMINNLPELNGDSELSKLLLDANLQTQALNPNSVTNSFVYQSMPDNMVGTFIKKWIFNGYAKGIVSSQTLIKDIFNNLQIGQESLIKSNIDLEEQYNSLMDTSTGLKLDIEFSEAVFAELKKVDLQPLTEVERQKYEMALEKVSRRIRDMETVRHALSHFFVSINQTNTTNGLLHSSIDSLMLVGPLIITNAMKIHAAINTQTQVINAVSTVSNALSDGLVQNAKLIEVNAQEVARLYNNPVLAMNKMHDAFVMLENAMTVTNNARASGIELSRKTALELRAMTESFENIAFIDNVSQDSLSENIKGH